MTGEPTGTEGEPVGSPHSGPPPFLAHELPLLSSDSLCDPFVKLLPITGVSISVLGAHGNQSTVCSSDEIAAKIDERQFELGEGPHWAALRTAAPVLVDDVQNDAGAGWPVFKVALDELEVGALFAIPMVMGAVVVGVVDLYRTSPGWLRPRDLYRAMAMAGSVTGAAVQNAITDADREGSTHSDTAPALRREVHQATGMISVQLDLNATDAFRRLKAEAFTSGRPIHDIARDVVQRRIDLRRPAL